MEYIYIFHMHIYFCERYSFINYLVLVFKDDHFDPLSFLKMKCTFVYFKLAITDRVG